jgi:hypothetical protein
LTGSVRGVAQTSTFPVALGSGNDFDIVILLLITLYYVFSLIKKTLYFCGVILFLGF